jgi:hypothetical protein
VALPFSVRNFHAEAPQGRKQKKAVFAPPGLQKKLWGWFSRPETFHGNASYGKNEITLIPLRPNTDLWRCLSGMERNYGISLQDWSEFMGRPAQEPKKCECFSGN